MKAKPVKTKPKNRTEDLPEEIDPEGYPLYPPTEDIYGNFEKDDTVDPEIPESIRRKTSRRIVEKFFADSDLDIPGSELIDDLDIIGEDEENDYYSLGGDDHNDLEEDNE
jgi:hypothetical protein